MARTSTTSQQDATTRASEAGQQSAQESGLQGSQARQQDQVAVQQGERGGLQNRGSQGLQRYGRDPFSMMQQFADEMDQLFDSFFYGTPARRSVRQSSAPTLWSPELELSQSGNELRICVDLPGVSKDNVKIDVQDGALAIQGERREERSEGGEQEGFRRTERRYGSFYRVIPLPEAADAEKAQAQMKDGVLEITVPLAPDKQPRRLEIKG
jgi:HSP20 family protein